MGHDSALEASKPYFEEFERKYGISVEDMAPALIMVLRMRDYLEKNKDKGFTYTVDLQNVDYFIREYFMKMYLDKALQRLEAALDEYLIRLKQAEAMRRSAGSGSIPGANDGCFNNSSGGST
jgi:Zn-dependent M16 (insulinase) family peptidase